MQVQLVYRVLTLSNPANSVTPQEALRDDKRVLECLQKALRIASSCVDEASSVQLYVQALDKYVYYFEQALEAVRTHACYCLRRLVVLKSSDLRSPRSI